MTRRPPTIDPRQQGFLLVMVMVSLAVLTVMVAVMASRADATRQQAQGIRDRGEALMRQFEAEQRARYQLAISPLTEFGAGVREGPTVNLAGARYRTSSSTYIELQDTGGLLDARRTSLATLARYLAAAGRDPALAARLIDQLKDYTDTDDFPEPLGAESKEYLGLGLPPPANDRLRSPHELNNIPAWVPLLQQTDAASHFTTNRRGGTNVNTAPFLVLRSLPGVTDPIARQLMQTRQSLGSIPTGTVAFLTDATIESAMFESTSQPSGMVRVRFFAAALPYGLEYNLRLTPFGRDAPWQIDYVARIPAPAGVEIDKLESLPPPPDAAQVPSAPLLLPP
jgi:type II secretory pathway component PulK